jgi:hypothetical protein
LPRGIICWLSRSLSSRNGHYLDVDRFRTSPFPLSSPQNSPPPPGHTVASLAVQRTVQCWPPGVGIICISHHIPSCPSRANQAAHSHHQTKISPPHISRKFSFLACHQSHLALAQQRRTCPGSRLNYLSPPQIDQANSWPFGQPRQNYAIVIALVQFIPPLRP